MLADDWQSITRHGFRRYPIGFANCDEAINRSLNGCLIDDIHIKHDLQADAVDGDKIGKWAWKPLFFILAANFTFGILLAGLPSFGIPAMGLNKAGF